MNSLHSTLRLGILLLVLPCSLGVAAQTNKAAQNNDQPKGWQKTSQKTE